MYRKNFGPFGSTDPHWDTKSTIVSSIITQNLDLSITQDLVLSGLSWPQKTSKLVRNCGLTMDTISRIVIFLNGIKILIFVKQALLNIDKISPDFDSPCSQFCESSQKLLLLTNICEFMLFVQKIRTLTALLLGHGSMRHVKSSRNTN